VLACIGAFAAVPMLLLLLPSRRPYPERAAASGAGDVVRNAVAIFRSRRFWLYFAAIFFGGGGEFCLTFWSASFVRLEFEADAMAGAVGTAAFSAGMFLGRTTFGRFVPQRRLKALIVSVGVFGTLVSLLVPLFAVNRGAFPPGAVKPALYALLFLCGIGSSPFWPSIQSLCVDRLPRLDSTLAFIVLSCSGVPGCGVFTYLMGLAGDRFGLVKSFAIVPACYVAMTALVLLADARRRRVEGG
ncbi:MAG: MFS transporter, partial [Kiritimatiellae bacterium]|nr:MFS transporter [Kiritimatiellia bacterium]